MRPWIARRALCGLLAAAVFVPAILLAQSPKPGPAARPIKNTVKGTPQRHEAILKRAKQGNIDLIFLGDSITQGWTSGGLGKSLFDARYAPVKGANFGVGSDQTNHALWRITTGGELKGLKPKLVVLMIGINNIASTKQSADQMAEGVAAIIKVIHTNHAGTQVLLMGTFPAGKAATHPHRARVKGLNVALARQANGTKVRFLDIGDKFLDAKGTQTAAFQKDTIHLSAKGYQIWADAIQPTIDSVVGKAPAKPTPTKPTPAGTRTRWVHADGELVATGNGVWVETIKTPTFTFVEKGRTAEHVELFDASRDYTLRLTATAMLIKGGKGIHPRFIDFTKQRDGKFADAAPTPSTKGKLAWGKKVSPEFRVKVVAIAKEIGVDPSHLMACMAFETQRTFRPDIVNGAGSGAMGLIQFTEDTARGLGTSTAALKKMTAVEQLDFVRKHFLPKKGKLKSIDDLYMDILFRVAVGKPDSFVLFTKDDKKFPKRYKQNAGLDRNPKDGKVTRGEACVPPRAMLIEGLSDKFASEMP